MRYSGFKKNILECSRTSKYSIMHILNWCKIKVESKLHQRCRLMTVDIVVFEHFLFIIANIS